MTATPRIPGATISVRDLRLWRSGREILQGVALDVAPGGITALVGSNGCGKSTLLKAIARILPVTSEQIELDGMSLDRLSARAIAQKLAMLPQSPISPEGMRVRDLVAQGRHPYRGLIRHWSPADDAAIARAMDDAGVSELAERPLTSLSGGQRQRCWIAMTLAQETGILLLDEPTTYLDLAVQMDIMRLLARLAAEGRTILVVLHELNLAAAFAERIVMMRSGVIRADGPPEEVMTQEHLADVFGLDAHVMADPESGRPVCLPRTNTAHR